MLKASTVAGRICYAVASVKKVLLLGGYGQLGVAIRRCWQAEIAAPRRDEVDIEHREQVEHAMAAFSPDVVVNCAAYHNVEQCEQNAGLAFAANAVAVGALAELCAQRGARFVTFSTDYVFDGTAGRPYTEADAPHPLNVYATSKLAGELLTLRLESAAYVVRTCGVYGERESTGKGHTFVQRILAQKGAGEPVRVVNDQTVSPTFAGDLADAVFALLDRDAPYGVYHAVNEGAVTWYDYAREALRLAGLDDTIEAVSYRSWGSKVRRPQFSALENARLHSVGITMPDWSTGLRRYSSLLRGVKLTP